VFTLCRNISSKAYSLWAQAECCRRLLLYGILITLEQNDALVNRIFRCFWKLIENMQISVFASVVLAFVCLL